MDLHPIAINYGVLETCSVPSTLSAVYCYVLGVSYLWDMVTVKPVQSN